jgi:predicted kinase
MKKLVVLSGLSGSGKSTYANQLKETMTCAVIRADEYNHCYTPETDVTGLLVGIVRSFAEEGISVIVDAVNLHPLDEMRWAEVAELFDEYVWHPMLTSLEECIRRDSLRPEPLGADVILQQLR